MVKNTHAGLLSKQRSELLSFGRRPGNTITVRVILILALLIFG